MDLDANIEDIEFPDDKQRVQEIMAVVVEMIIQEPNLFKEESMTQHSAMFDKFSNKLVFEKTNARNKKKFKER